MEMHQVRYFLAVARHLNFTRAADELRVAQPSLTRAIQKLEAELHGPLFRRERQHTHLTELGRMMLPHLQASLAAAENAKAQARRLRMQAIGSLTLGIGSDTDMEAAEAMVVATARSLDNLSLTVEVAPTATIERQLLAGEFDAAIVAPSGSVPERFDCHLLRDDAFVVAFEKGHRFAAAERVALETLGGEPLAIWACRRTDDALARLMDELAADRATHHRSNDAAWIAIFVRNGLGCAIVPEALARAHALVHRGLDGLPLRQRTVLATVAGRRHSAALAALIRRVAMQPA